MEQAILADDEQCQAQRRTGPEISVELTVVVPISEGRGDLRELYLQYAQELSTAGYVYEFIFVLDGPDDHALQTLKALKREHLGITVVTLNRQFGEAVALSAGFERARGAIILTLAPHFQVETHKVHGMLKKLAEEDEYDLVTAWRYPRIDSLFNRVQSRAFHWLIEILTGMRYHDISCGLRVMKRQVAEEIHLYGDLHRFFPLLAHQRGFHVVEVPVQQSWHDTRPRVYGPGSYLRRLLDILTIFFLFKFTNKPLRFFGLGGLGLLGAGASVTSYLGVYRLLGFGPIADRPLLMLAILLMVFGIQLFSIGLLGEIIIFTHARDVKEYQIKEILEE
jgi:glycosyltransferase involved in cell wall biosynthesis